jgi:hypothetical protein
MRLPIIAAPSKPIATAGKSPAGPDRISRLAPNDPVSDIESLLIPQTLSGLRMKRALDAERDERMRKYY